jgi:chemotaxis response regulator CheB
MLWLKLESCLSTREELFRKIKKINPDVVVIDLDLYDRIDGIETSWMIRLQLDITVMYV